MSPNSVQIPVYLNEDLFRDALNDGFKRKDVKVKSLSLKLISEGGENYCSDIYRANVQYTTDSKQIKTITLIVKDMKDCYNAEIPLPSREVDMYTTIVPLMEEMLGETDVLAPKCFKATREYNELYIFQDLGDLGYAVQDRISGLNEEQVHILLKKIGVFHAASMVIAKKHPDIIAKVKAAFYEEGISKVPLIANLIFGNLDHLNEVVVKNWEGFEDIAIKLQKLRRNYDEKLLAVVNSSQNKYKVLNHGDLWVNNIMFKQDNGTCVDAKLIDLQICCYGSPGVDLHYFFTTSIPLDIGLPRRYDLLRTYYKSFKSTLVRLKYSSIPTWNDLLHELRVTEFYALQTVLFAVPLICLEKEASKGNDLASLKDAELMKKQRELMYKSKRTVLTTRYILNRMNDIGVLD